MESIVHRANRRGLKKCLNCGQYNGIRAKTCKNKKCSSSQAGDQKSGNLRAVLLCGIGDTKTYSVRVRDRGPEFRSFVRTIDQNLSSDEDGCSINRQTTCFVDTCREISAINPSCKHVRSASETQEFATPLPVSKSAVFGLAICSETKQWLWATYGHDRTSVQRINRNLFAVRTDTNDQFPVGLVHLNLAVIGGSGFASKSICSCKRSKGVSMTVKELCHHLQILLAAILTDCKLRDEFAIQLQLLTDRSTVEQVPKKFCTPEDFLMADDQYAENSICIEPSHDLANLELTDCHIELMDQFKLTDQIDLCHDAVDVLTEAVCFANSLDGDTVESFDPMYGNHCDNAKPLENNNTKQIDCPLLSFDLWMSAVIERINMSMPYGGDGVAGPIMFSVSQPFFDHLKERFSSRRKKRLPNSTCCEVSGPYAGKTRYTWHFNSESRLRKIFSNPFIYLQLEISFIKTVAGNYEVIDPETIDSPSPDRKISKLCRIRPVELKTFMKIGKSKSDLSNDNVSSAKEQAYDQFSIEWIPNVLPLSGYGEMFIRFEYGHKKNNLIQ